MAAPRFKNFIKRADRSVPPTGATRCGVHGNLEALLDPTSAEAAKVAMDMPAVMIRTIKYLGSSEGSSPAQAMGVKAHALYAYLMASARLELANATNFLVPYEDAKKFLQIERTDRLREYMTALNRTMVSYDFTEKDGVRNIGDSIQLLSCRTRIMPDGKSYIKYSMPDDVRTVILAAKSYAWEELAAFSKFSSKYAPRLYPILALRAGMSFEQPHPLVFETEELAAQLGWTHEPGKLKFSHFEARCLLPALADIKEHVQRFQVLECKPIHADTRGRPVIRISFTVSHAIRPLEERQKMETSASEKGILQALMERRGLSMQTEIPAIDTLARAATVLDTTTIKVAERWANVLARAREVPALPFGATGDGIGQDILDTMESRGVGAAFGMWLTDPEPYDPLIGPKCADGMEALEEIPECDSRSTSHDLSDYLNSILNAA
ncbi:replication initiation protein [Sinorhizobium meliloti]|uniref:replication initiation protein n=1 Tax=Rhizobium meliloti TaxID=382 RepID=UPI000FE0FC95|nr:replication initiation protein [Sinorhizobium meliloti]RVL94717.1 RepB family plasmid replication initiator protein [Sinorhizobium meliloti]